MLVLTLLCGTVILTVLTHRTERIAADYGRTLAQATADAAALAAAASFLGSVVDADTATQRALETIRLNDANPRVRVAAKKIVIDTEQGHSTVEVEARLSPFPAPIGWLLGSRELVVNATATGEAQAVRCQELGPDERGFPIMRCDGVVKALRLLSEPDGTVPPQ